jgi:hypothetical protein
LNAVGAGCAIDALVIDNRNTLLHDDITPSMHILGALSTVYVQVCFARVRAEECTICYNAQKKVNQKVGSPSLHLQAPPNLAEE